MVVNRGELEVERNPSHPGHRDRGELVAPAADQGTSELDSQYLAYCGIFRAASRMAVGYPIQLRIELSYI